MADVARPFPAIEPSSRAYNPGEYPQTQFQAQNGAVSVIRFSNRRVNSSLELGFNNITDDQAALILGHYENVNSDWDYATFTDSTGAIGASDNLAAYLRETGGSGLRWRYAGPPSVSSVRPGRSSVSCSFIGILDGN